MLSMNSKIWFILLALITVMVGLSVGLPELTFVLPWKEKPSNLTLDLTLDHMDDEAAKAKVIEDNGKRWEANENLPRFTGKSSLEPTFVRNNEKRTDLPSYTEAVNKCSTDQFVALVQTRTYAFENRERMRNSPILNITGKRAQIFFFLGTTNEHQYNQESEDRLLEELQREKDIVRINMIDAYQTTRMKAITTIRYFVEHCEKSPYVFFFDDDVDPQLTLDLYQNWIQNDDVHCLKDLVENSAPFRDKAYRFYISPEEYPLGRFPPFCSGPCYGMNRRTAEKIYEEIKYRSYYIYDDICDVYMTGIFRTLADVGIQWPQTICHSHSDAGDVVDTLTKYHLKE